MTPPLAFRDRELPPLSTQELVRYSRHLTLPHVGVEGQRRLKAARVLVVGAGGLGSPVALYLAAAGIGTMGLVEFDVVDLTNLQRQLLHGTDDVGRPKIESARDRLHGVNPHVRLEEHPVRLTAANALDIVREYDLVIDGTDNFATRYLTNDACVLLGKPNVYGSIYRFEGQASLFATGTAPCYRCLYAVPPPAELVPNCAEGGVLGVLPGMVGTIMATEAIKLILGIGETLAGRLLLVDALTMQFRTLRIHRDPSCPMCGTRTIRELIDYDDFCNVSDSSSSVQAASVVDEITPVELAQWMRDGVQFELIDVREPAEWEIGRLPGARLIPLAQVDASIESLSRDHQIVVMCRSGKRSAAAAGQLQAAGFRRVKNLTGGILRWSDDVDPTVPKY